MVCGTDFRSENIKNTYYDKYEIEQKYMWGIYCWQWKPQPTLYK